MNKINATTKIKEIISQMSIEEKVGQMCVPILQSGEITETIKKYITEYKVGMLRFCPIGEFDNASRLVGEPTPVKSPSEMAAFTNELQKLALSNPVPIPLFIAVDQEGGTRNDMNRGSLVYSSHMAFGAADDLELTYNIAKATAEEFAAMGINFVQAPIIDVFRYSGKETMKAATFGENRDKVTEHAIAMLKGFQDGGIYAMLKHFPGYGSIATDPHKGIARILKNLDSLENEDFYPVKKLIELGVDGIMVGHAVTECIDPDYPATLSKKILRGYLREKLGFEGLMETDAMRMHSIQDLYTTEEATILAANAGNDLILLRGDFEHFKEGYNGLVNAVKCGKVLESVIDEAVSRILKYKFKKEKSYWYKENVENADRIVGTEEHMALARKLAEKSVTTLRTQNIPLDMNKKVLVLCSTPTKLCATLDERQCEEMLLKSFSKINPNADVQIFSRTPDEKDIDRIIKLAQNTDVVVLGTFNAVIYDEQITLDRELKKLGKPIINVAMESPCDIDVLDNVTDYICMLGCAADWADIVAECVYGQYVSIGKLPITLKIQ